MSARDLLAKVFTASATSIAVAIAVAVAPATATADIPFWQISEGLQKCLDVTNGSTLDGAIMQQWNCNGGENQQFFDESVVAGYYRIRTVETGRCLGVSNNSTKDLAPIEQRLCASGFPAYQEWKFIPTGTPNQYEFQAKSSGKCMDVRGMSTADGAVIQQFTCNKTSNQIWSFSIL